jgi:type II restriction/modification system DNA methylase subunit YeeA
VLPLTGEDIGTLIDLARLDWSAIEPSIFGTLFERGLDPDKRSQLGAHYTDPESILRIVNPVVIEPLRQAWSETKASIEKQRAKIVQAQAKAAAAVEKAQKTFDKAAAAKAQTAAKTAETKALNQAATLYKAFLERLAQFRVLDPLAAPETSCISPCAPSRTWSTNASWRPRPSAFRALFPRLAPRQSGESS